MDGLDELEGWMRGGYRRSLVVVAKLEEFLPDESPVRAKMLAAERRYQDGLRALADRAGVEL